VKEENGGGHGSQKGFSPATGIVSHTLASLLYYDIILFTEYLKPTSKKSSKSFKQKTCKNLPNLFWLRNPQTAGAQWSSSRLFSQDLIRFWDNKLQFWPEHLHITKSGVKIADFHV
jgi:hypothetical protein